MPEGSLSYSMSTRRGLPVCDLRGADRWEDFEPLVTRLLGLGVEIVQRIDGPDTRLLHFIYRGEPLTLACDDPYGHELWAVEERGREALETLARELCRPAAPDGRSTRGGQEPRQTGWDPELKQRLLDAIPCERGMFFDEPFVLASDPDKVVRGGLLFRRVDLVAIDGNRRLYATHRTFTGRSALVWMTMEGDRVVGLSFVEGEATTRTLIAHRYDFPAVQLEQLRQLFAPGSPLPEGYHHHMLIKARRVEPLPGGGALRRYTISTPPAVIPRRLAVLDVTVDDKGLVVGLHHATHDELLAMAERSAAEQGPQSAGR